MTSRKTSKASDFRYNTGAARVPWDAVGERLREQEIIAVLKFLCPPQAGKSTPHARQ